jgi:FkbM family methyltransferase
MTFTHLLDPVRRQWMSESSPIALRTKQLVASVLPERLLIRLKKRYYLGLLRKDSDELMETDARALPLLVQAGDFTIDVGAFVGFYTQRLSRCVGPAGLVWSFEPMPLTHDILETAVRRLNLGNVKVFPYAVSADTHVATMEVPRYKRGGESWWDARIIHESRSRRAGFRHVDITTCTLDSLLAGSERPVTFIKIDAEYHEYECVRGAAASLRRWRPTIQIETLDSIDSPGSNPHAMVELLASMGYAPYYFDGTAMRPRAPGENHQNLFFLTERHRHLL